MPTSPQSLAQATHTMLQAPECTGWEQHLRMNRGTEAPSCTAFEHCLKAMLTPLPP